MAATLLTPAQLRMHLETDLADEALQRLLDSEEGEIVRRYGEHATATEVLVGTLAGVLLSRPALSVTSVTEESPDADPLELAADDYVAWYGGRLLTRSMNGTNPAWSWAPRVTVVYVPVSNVEQRRLVLIRLCQLAAAFNGTQAEAVGDYRMSALDYQRERERALRTVSPRQVMFA